MTALQFFFRDPAFLRIWQKHYRKTGKSVVNHSIVLRRSGSDRSGGGKESGPEE